MNENQEEKAQKKVIVCWHQAGHDVISAVELPENANILAAWDQYIPGENCPICGATPREIEESLSR